MDHNTMGCDRVPIICKLGECLTEESINLSLRLNNKRTNWIKFEENVNLDLSAVDREKEADEWNSSLIKVMWSATATTITKKRIPQRGTMVPWWNEECNLDI